MRGVTGILFSPCNNQGCLKPDGFHELVKIVDNALMEPVELTALLLL